MSHAIRPMSRANSEKFMHPFSKQQTWIGAYIRAKISELPHGGFAGHKRNMWGNFEGCVYGTILWYRVCSWNGTISGNGIISGTNRHKGRPSQQPRHNCSTPLPFNGDPGAYIRWQRRNFVPYVCQLIFTAILLVKPLEMFVILLPLKCAFFL